MVGSEHSSAPSPQETGAAGRVPAVGAVPGSGDATVLQVAPAARRLAAPAFCRRFAGSDVCALEALSQCRFFPTAAALPSSPICGSRKNGFPVSHQVPYEVFSVNRRPLTMSTHLRSWRQLRNHCSSAAARPSGAHKPIYLLGKDAGLFKLRRLCCQPSPATCHPDIRPGLRPVQLCLALIGIGTGGLRASTSFSTKHVGDLYRFRTSLELPSRLSLVWHVLPNKGSFC